MDPSLSELIEEIHKEIEYIHHILRNGNEIFPHRKFKIKNNFLIDINWNGMNWNEKRIKPITIVYIYTGFVCVSVSVCRMAPKWCSSVTVLQHENQFHVNWKGGRTIGACTHVYDPINVKNVVCVCLLTGWLACLFAFLRDFERKGKEKNANKITAYVRCDTHVCLHAYRRKHTITARHTRWTNSMLCKRSIDVYVLQRLFRMCCLHALMCAWPCLGPCMCDMKSVARLYTCISLCECVCVCV